MKTKHKLVQALREANAPQALIINADLGCYDDFESDSATPINDLVKACLVAGLNGLAERAMQGEFDSTAEEANEWFEKEGRNLLG